MPGERLTEVTDLVGLHAASLFKQGFSERSPIVSIGRSQTDPSDDDPLIIRQQRGAVWSDHNTSTIFDRERPIQSFVGQEPVHLSGFQPEQSNREKANNAEEN